MKVSMYTYGKKKYIIVGKGGGRRRGMLQFKRIRRFLWWYYPSKEPAFWVDRDVYTKYVKYRKKK